MTARAPLRPAPAAGQQGSRGQRRAGRATAHEVARLRPAFDHALALEQQEGADHGGDAEVMVLAGLAFRRNAFALTDHALGDLSGDVRRQRLIQFQGVLRDDNEHSLCQPEVTGYHTLVANGGLLVTFYLYRSIGEKTIGYTL